MNLSTPVDPPPNAAIHAPLIPVKTNGCDVGFLNFENEEEVHSSPEKNDKGEREKFSCSRCKGREPLFPVFKFLIME